MPNPEKRLESLLDLMLDGSASDAQRQEFAELLEQRRDLVPSLIIQLRTHSLLQWQCDNVQVDGDVRDFGAELNISQNVGRRRKTAIDFLRHLAAIAALVLVASGGMFGLIWWLQASDDVAVAEVVEDKGVVWSDATAALQSGGMVRAGRLEIESGELTLRFRSGATVSLRGAAIAQIESDMLVRLDRGQATAHVPHWAKGFTIETDHVEVVDLGTEFGVAARDDGLTDVVIFEGQVDLKRTEGTRRVQTRLNQGEAARVSSNGSIGRIVEVRSNNQGGWSTTNHPGESFNMFKAIRDNIPTSDGSKYYYYQITTAGLQDDAWAYVDRHPHQWNGLTADGLPGFLRGADYARTFNDYRYIDDLEIVVELAGPAILYVFFDDRVPTPDWLLENFEDTGIDIGLDEGPWEGIPDHRNAVGGGESIDNVFSVWQRRCEHSETVRLGAVGDSSEARAMYGIAATPITVGRSSNEPNVRSRFAFFSGRRDIAPAPGRIARAIPDLMNDDGG